MNHHHDPFAAVEGCTLNKRPLTDELRDRVRSQRCLIKTIKAQHEKYVACLEAELFTLEAALTAAVDATDEDDCC